MDLCASIFAFIGLIIGIISYERDVGRKLVYINYYLLKYDSEGQ